MTLPMGWRLTDMLKAERLAEDVVLGSEWLWPSPTSARGHVVEPKEKSSRRCPSSSRIPASSSHSFHRERRALCGKCPPLRSKASGGFGWLRPAGASHRAFATLHAGT